MYLLEHLCRKLVSTFRVPLFFARPQVRRDKKAKEEAKGLCIDKMVRLGERYTLSRAE